MFPSEHECFDDQPHEECGVFGASTPHGEGIAQLAFFGLFALQHRGQEAAGIAVSDGSRLRVHKDAGLVANVFTPATMTALTGYHAMGHTRYSTTGGNSLKNIQPFVVETMPGPLAVGHNATRFSRDPSEFNTTSTSLTVIANADSEGAC